MCGLWHNTYSIRILITKIFSFKIKKEQTPKQTQSTKDHNIGKGLYSQNKNCVSIQWRFSYFRTFSSRYELQKRKWCLLFIKWKSQTAVTGQDPPVSLWSGCKHGGIFTNHGDVVAVEEDLVQFGYPPSLWCDFTGTQIRECQQTDRWRS